MIGTLHGQTCKLPYYELKPVKGQENILKMSAFYHLGAKERSSCMGGPDGPSHYGVAYGLMPGMLKSEISIDNSYSRYDKVDCSKYKFHFPADSMYVLDTNRFTAYESKAQQRDQTLPFQAKQSNNSPCSKKPIQKWYSICRNVSSRPYWVVQLPPQ